ncbi:DUF389 domain-containing protein [Phenylobacterium sp.]|uniref:DUF389 domain-containing protein n=1 Tax=Phenylobacterium sp. TaxID=1871053 RepID=UPI0035AE0C02
MLTPIARHRAKALLRLGVMKCRQAVHALALTCPEEQRRRIEADIHAAGRISNGYLLLLTCACGIAILGLLQSSAAVVIGAMLISPLMGPIMSMGVSLARFDPPTAKEAGISLAVGALGAIAASALIVWLSPLKDVTPEILARTRPTLLDLVVAVLSGVVGAYVTITQRGAVIAGVAIATALMPPLAVVGYGVATMSPQIAGGALLLFLTNVVAILAAVYGVALLYGFRHVGAVEARWQTPVLLGAMTALCVPLALSLRSIVIEAKETGRARAVIEKTFADQSPRVSDLEVQLAHSRLSKVQAVVLTRKYVSGAEASVKKALGQDCTVELEQVLVAEGEPAASGSALANRALTAQATAPRTPEARLREMLSATGQVSSIDRQDGAITATVVLPGSPGLSSYRALEIAAQRFLPDTEVQIVPPFAPLPVISFARGSRALSGAARADLAVTAWALKRWGLSSVRVEGVASPGRRGPRRIDQALAEGRAQAVADALSGLGVTVSQVSGSVPDTPGVDSPDLWVARLTPEGQAR